MVPWHYIYVYIHTYIYTHTYIYRSVSAHGEGLLGSQPRVQEVERGQRKELGGGRDGIEWGSLSPAQPTPFYQIQRGYLGSPSLHPGGMDGLGGIKVDQWWATCVRGASERWISGAEIHQWV